MTCLVAATLPLTACGGGGQSTAQVETLLREQLPETIRQDTGKGVVVETALCAKGASHQYDCTAHLASTNGAGQLSFSDVSVSATCDSHACVWHVNP